jgi:hypothetical protein
VIIIADFRTTAAFNRKISAGYADLLRWDEVVILLNLNLPDPFEDLISESVCPSHFKTLCNLVDTWAIPLLHLKGPNEVARMAQSVRFLVKQPRLTMTLKPVA